MKKLIIVLLICAILLSIPCATAASLSDLDSDAMLLKLDNDNSQPILGMKNILLNKDSKIMRAVLDFLFKIKRK
ncbi:MAG: hypothetical protein Q4P14_01320 [Methanobacteriaceae archaeon]|nr:hypothetical protein [Methanobacteriaceae archaeon]